MASQRPVGLPTPTLSPRQHTESLRAVKEALEIAQRQRGDQMKSFVRLEELVALGLADQYGNLTPSAGPASAPALATEHIRLRALLRFRGT